MTNYTTIKLWITSHPKQPELQPFNVWESHEMILHLLLYYIEKDYNFTGEGIFNTHE